MVVNVVMAMKYELEHKIKSVQTICEIGPLCWLYTEFWYCLRILSSLTSAAGAGAVLYQNDIRFPLGMRN